MLRDVKLMGMGEGQEEMDGCYENEGGERREGRRVMMKKKKKRNAVRQVMRKRYRWVCLSELLWVAGELGRMAVEGQKGPERAGGLLSP